MIILGIDPGTTGMGYGIVNAEKGTGGKNQGENKFECIEYGLVQVAQILSVGERLKKINNVLSKIIKKHRPELLAIESLFFFRNFKTAISVSQASGVVIMTAAKNNIPVYSYTPLQVKMMVAGHGFAEKKKVQERIKKILKLKEIPKPDDAADALAIAITYFLKNHA